MTAEVILVFIFVLGAIVGSFLNVCIYRIPAGESIVFPASRCPACKAAIHWYQNIPILSYLFLGGRCASCRVRISWRYPFVEALTGALFALVVYRFGLHGATLVFCVLSALLVVITFIDLDHQLIPDVISLPGIVLGFLGSFLVPWLSWSDSLFGILLGGGSLYLVAAGYELLAKKEGMGGGDIKLLAMLGAFLGWKAVLPVIFLSSLMGSLVGIPLMLIKRADGRLAIPFGPFLAAGALVFLFWGPGLLRWYLSFF
jgi:leader peptidase (prepilin peptidase)/N-methyltransferase